MQGRKHAVLRSTLPCVLASGCLAALLALQGCSAILGFEDLSPMPADASIANDGSVPDGSVSDASDTSTPDTSPDTSTPDTSPDTTPDTSDDQSSQDSPSGDVVDADLDAWDAEDTQDAQPESGCGDTVSSSDNCGRCGHSCQGLPCVDSKCTSTMLVSVNDYVIGVGVNDTSLFYTGYNTHVVRRVDKATGLNPVTWEGNNPGMVLVDSNFFFWPDRQPGGDLARMPVGANASNHPTLIASDEPWSICIAGDWIYWSEQSGMRVQRMRKDTLQDRTVLYTGTTELSHLAVSDTYVYFIDVLGVLRRIPLDGVDAGSPEQLDSTGYSGFIKTTDTFLYYTVNSASGAIFRMNLPGDSRTTLATGLNIPSFIATDADNVYWVNTASDAAAEGSLVYCPHNACPPSGPILIAGELGKPQQIALDATTIYVALTGVMSQPGTHGVLKVAKP